MKYLIFVTVLFLLSATRSYAAFPVNNQESIRVAEDSASMQAYIYSAPAEHSAPIVSPASGTNGMATASLVCGIVGLLVAGIPLGTLAIIFGYIGMTNGKPHRNRALAGLIIGIVAVVGALVSLAVKK